MMVHLRFCLVLAVLFVIAFHKLLLLHLLFFLLGLFFKDLPDKNKGLIVWPDEKMELIIWPLSGLLVQSMKQLIFDVQCAVR